MILPSDRFPIRPRAPFAASGLIASLTLGASLCGCTDRALATPTDGGVDLASIDLASVDLAVVDLADLAVVEDLAYAPPDLSHAPPLDLSGPSGPGLPDIWGLGYWDGKLFGFTESNGIVVIDIGTGKATPVPGTDSFSFWGAGVITNARTSN